MANRQDIDEAVSLQDYNADWPQVFEREARLLRPIFTDRLLGMEHIGSTAIPGLRAKPVIDIMIGLPAADISSLEQDDLSSLGYEFFGEAGIEGRLYLRKRGPFDCNLAIVQHQSLLWTDNIAFRDYLRNNESARHRYQQAKESALQNGAARLLEYSRNKSTMITILLNEAPRSGA